MTNTKVKRKDVLSNGELEEMLERAKSMGDRYMGLRAGAVHGILAKTGKRRTEVARLEMADLNVCPNGDLDVRFTVAKKRKREATQISLQRTKTLPAGDPFTEAVKEYYWYMKKNHPASRWLFPSLVVTFNTYRFDYGRHISGRTVLRIVKALNPDAWVHLYRETVGARIVDKHPTLDGVFKVANRLDIGFNTAVHYFQRHVKQRIDDGE